MIPEALTIGRMVLSLRLLLLFASVSGGRAGIVVGALLAAGPLFIVLYTGTALHHMLTEGPAHAAARGRVALLRSLVE